MPPKSLFHPGWNRLTAEDQHQICHSCRMLSKWGRLCKLVMQLNEGSWHAGPPEQAGKVWPSTSSGAWNNIKRGFKHSIPLADANYLEFFDEDRRVGKFHEEQLKHRDARLPRLGYLDYLRHAGVPRSAGVHYMPERERNAYKIEFRDQRLVLPAAYPPEVRQRIVEHSRQREEEDEGMQHPGQAKPDKPKHRVIFVADAENIYINIKNEGTIQHSTFLAGRPAFMAGYLTLRDFNSADNSFKITKIKGKSGHYRPELEQFIVFLWALELVIPLDGITASYAVAEGTVKRMVKVDAAVLLRQHRGRVIPGDAPDDLRFQLAFTDQAPAAPLVEGPVDEAAARPTLRRRTRDRTCCGICGCTVQ